MRYRAMQTLRVRASERAGPRQQANAHADRERQRRCESQYGRRPRRMLEGRQFPQHVAQPAVQHHKHQYVPA